MLSRLTIALFRFFETEAIAILVMLISRYKIELPDEPEFAGETFEEKKKRLFAATQGLTLLYVSMMIYMVILDSRLTQPYRPVRNPLVFTRRRRRRAWWSVNFLARSY